ncbi:CARDB domain-containing protein [Chloroflexota bacterium]
MRSKWRLFLFVGLVLLLTTSVIGCTESYTQEDLDAAYETGNAEGYDAGYTKGTDAGVARLESELISTKQTLTLTQSELDSTKQTLTLTQSELSSTKQTLTETQDKLKDAKAELLLSNIKVTNLSISPDYVELDEKVTISATVTNSGGIQLNYTAILTINGSEVEKKGVVLDAGESKVVSYTVAKASAGKYTIELGGLAGTFTVVGAQVIKDLAYIKISVWSYSDDADPERDGISLNITFYNSKSEPIGFQDIPVSVIIELYGSISQWGLPSQVRELVYRDKVIIDHCKARFSGAEINIPYESIIVDQNRYYKIGDAEVTITTPKQGSFRGSSGLAILYDEP